MEISISQEQARVPVTVFHITGDIDASTSGQLESQAQQAIQTGTRFLLLDLSQVTFISSHGVHSISQIFNWLRDKSEDDHALSHGLRDGKFKAHHLKLAKPSPHVRNVLTTAGIDMFIEFHSNLKKAVESF